jgi:hypothetical protein
MHYVFYRYDACFKFRVVYIEGVRGRGTEKKIWI